MRTNGHHRRLFAPIAGLLAAISVLLAPAPALAGGSPTPGVHIDPNSPVAKQYAIPLGVARGTPAGSSSKGSLFGHGITPAAPASGAPSTSTTTRQASRAGHHKRSKGGSRRRVKAVSGAGVGHTGGSGGQRGSDASAADATPPPVLKVLHPGSGPGIVWMVGLAALVLALGGAGGLAVAGRGRRSSPRAG